VLFCLAAYYSLMLPIFLMRKLAAISNKNKNIMLIFGSGGHTTELLLSI
jgi:hypothetical protein